MYENTVVVSMASFYGRIYGRNTTGHTVVVDIKSEAMTILF